MKRVIRSDKPVTLLLLLWSHKCDIGAEPRSRIIVTLAVKGLMDTSERNAQPREKNGNNVPMAALKSLISGCDTF
jgi:hypothetical protein